jgi:hypothetical protein
LIRRSFVALKPSAAAAASCSSAAAAPAAATSTTTTAATAAPSHVTTKRWSHNIVNLYVSMDCFFRNEKNTTTKEYYSMSVAADF